MIDITFGVIAFQQKTDKKMTVNQEFTRLASWSS